MSIAQLKTTNILKDWMTTINSIISSLGGYYTKEEMNDILYNGLYSTQYVWTADKDYAEESIITLTEFYYPLSFNALIVSLDGFILSYALQYEEVATQSSDIVSNQIKIRVPIKKGMILNVWVAPVFANNATIPNSNISMLSLDNETTTQSSVTVGNDCIINGNSSKFNETSEDIVVSNGTANTAWTKMVRLTDVSTITLGTSWDWKDGVVPTIVAGGILVCCWCGSGGIATFMSPSS